MLEINHFIFLSLITFGGDSVTVKPGVNLTSDSGSIYLITPKGAGASLKPWESLVIKETIMWVPIQENSHVKK